MPETNDGYMLFRLINDAHTPAGDLFFGYDASDIDALAVDTDLLWERAGKAVDRGILTRNQALEIMGYGKSDDPAMDVPTVPAVVVPISAIAGAGEEE